MKRKLAVLVLVALVTLLAATPALAAGPSGGKGQQHQRSNGQDQQHQNGNGMGQQHQNGSGQGQQPVRQLFSLVGVITALDSSSITVQVYNGNRIAQPYIGQALTVQLTGSTRYQQWMPNGCVPIAFGEVAVGDTASIQGTVSDGTFTAQRVTVDAPHSGQ